MFRSRSTSASRPMGTGLYGPVVIALAIFLVVVGIGRISGGRFLATARIQGTVSSESRPSISIGAIRSQLADAEFVRAAALDAHPLAADTGTLPSAATIIESLAIDIEPTQAGRQWSVCLEFISANALTSEAVVNAMGHHFVHEQSQLPCRREAPGYRNRHQQATRAVAEAERQHIMARRAMDTFLSDHLDQILHPSVDRPHSATNRTTAANSLRTTFARLPTTLPDVAVLQSQRVGLSQKRAAMLETMTFSHPSVQDLSQRIAHVERQLAAAAVVETQRQAEIDRIAAAGTAQTRKQLKLEFERLNNAVAQAANVREAAREDERRAWEREGDQRPAITWQVLPAMRARRVPDPISRGTLLLGSVLAMIGGGGAMVSRRRGRTIDSVSDAQTAFQSPVVGTVTEPASVLTTIATHRSRKLRAWILGSEIVLLVALGAMIVVALIDKDFGSQLRADPLSALVDGTGRLLQIFFP